MENISGKKRPTISLSLFTTFSESISSDKSPNAIKSPRNFQEGVVGLGIVAAMTDLGNPNEVALSDKSPRSSPIPIVSAAKPAANFRGGFCVERAGAVVDELSESYTCVITHFGNNLTSKRVYFDDELSGVVDDPNAGVVVASEVFYVSPLSVGEVGREFWASDFLSWCYLCKKQLHGLDIFMYRGEKAFCSTECRDKHIRSDDHKEKCRSTTRSTTWLTSPTAKIDVGGDPMDDGRDGHHLVRLQHRYPASEQVPAHELRLPVFDLSDALPHDGLFGAQLRRHSCDEGGPIAKLEVKGSVSQDLQTVSTLGRAVEDGDKFTRIAENFIPGPISLSVAPTKPISFPVKRSWRRRRITTN